MKTFVLLVFASCFVGFLSAQTTETQPFPQSWVGVWTGELEIFNAKGKVQAVPMELHIQPIANSQNYTWTIIYGEDREAGARPYELQAVDAEVGHYVIDEKNSIRLDAFLVGGKLYERFSVMGSMLIATTELQGNQLIYEIISGSDKAVSTTGNTTVEGEDIPAVESFPIAVRQQAVLRKKE